MRYIIQGTPIPLQRARFSARHCWDAQKLIKAQLRIALENQHGDLPLFSGPVKLIIEFYFGFPQSMSKVRRQSLLSKPHFFRPDLSNLIKFYEDIGTGILYDDDCIIASIEAFKRYDEHPRTEFCISEIKET